MEEFLPEIVVTALALNGTVGCPSGPEGDLGEDGVEEEEGE